jgi:glycosyltransferase involved in cell wall biosynthesis
MKISALIITYNEERNIARCIDSLKPVADEIIVIDSFSKDQTEAICISKGVKFIQHPFEGFIFQKNFALLQANFDYVLSLDADECLSKELEASILNVKQSGTPQKAYSFNRLTNYCGQWIKHCGWYPDRKVRLWHKEFGKWAGKGLHETVKLNEGVKANRLSGDLQHYSFNTINDHIEQIHFFTDIGAQGAFDNGERSNLLKILVKPAFKLFRDYILKLGFMDGYYGFIICANSSYAKFLKYVKLKEIQNGKFFLEEEEV